MEKKKSKKFIDPKNSIHFRVVHRSQRDPALSNENSSPFVLAPLPPSRNLLKKGKYQAKIPENDYHFDESESILDIDDKEWDNEEGDDDQYEDFDDDDDENWEDEDDLEEEEENETETKVQETKPAQETKSTAKKNPLAALLDDALKEDAAMHGILFTDQDKYDYMQHLKIIGEDPQAVFIESKKSEKLTKPGEILFKENEISKPKVTFNLPEEALPSNSEHAVGLLNQAAPTSILDVEPAVREIMYALDDDAYVDNELDDDFFAALNADEPPEGAILEEYSEEDDNEDDDWYNEFKKFKKKQSQENDVNSDVGSDDDVGGNKVYKARTAKTAITSLSMTSSALFRNKHLTLLDDKFEQVLASYDEEDEDEDNFVPGDEDFDEDDDDYATQSHSGAPPVLSRVQEDAIDMILERIDVSGKRMKDIPEGGGMGQFETMRKQMMEGLSKEDILKADEAIEQRLTKKLPADMEFVRPKRKEQDKWDVETVLTTYSSIYNRPKFISEVSLDEGRRRKKKGSSAAPSEVTYEKDIEPVRLIELGKGGIPKRELWKQDEGDEESESEQEEVEVVNKGVARKKSETKEEKKKRKEMVKEDKKNRRTEKKQTKMAFKEERTKQVKTLNERVLQDKIRPIS